MSIFDSILGSIFSGGSDEKDVTEDNIIYDDDDYDEEDSERISVWDAADIWRSHGKDEDYMFGYTEEELEDA